MNVFAAGIGFTIGNVLGMLPNIFRTKDNYSLAQQEEESLSTVEIVIHNGDENIQDEKIKQDETIQDDKTKQDEVIQEISAEIISTSKEKWTEQDIVEIVKKL